MIFSQTSLSRKEFRRAAVYVALLAFVVPLLAFAEADAVVLLMISAAVLTGVAVLLYIAKQVPILEGPADGWGHVVYGALRDVLAIMGVFHVLTLLR
jgi:hypothetical protein